ncbi:hypothetical protein SAMN05216480_11659 [Pustulibacterium marinum]|uniref:Uncharacterized protein n=1 Tax=Pustulibacterium marinum TaxID=1224947 RepID=A0A1I7IHL5_9FLAO|nr:hypothetical protein [Pustulibacterium marinum]SFU72428.1 hypothetical protein SAMN05216480_11659 [Pustulibacterium marinum]
MEQSFFTSAYKDKTHEELIQIIEDNETYTEEARYTAIIMLENRGGDISKWDPFKQNYENTQAKEKRFNELLKKQQSQQEEKEEFVLYSKNLILIFCILFSTLFGAALLAYNMKIAGKKQGVTQVLLFALFYVLGGVLISLVFQTDMSALFLNVISGFILTEYYWNKHLGATVKYVKKSWVKPTLISLVIVFVFMGILWYMLGAPTDMETFMKLLEEKKG